MAAQVATSRAVAGEPAAGAGLIGGLYRALLRDSGALLGARQAFIVASSAAPERLELLAAQPALDTTQLAALLDGGLGALLRRVAGSRVAHYLDEAGAMASLPAGGTPEERRRALGLRALALPLDAGASGATLCLVRDPAARAAGALDLEMVQALAEQTTVMIGALKTGEALARLETRLSEEA